MIHLGFTGTQKGMTYQQRAGVEAILLRWMGGPPAGSGIDGRITVHHGGCVGADHEFHLMALTHDLDIEVYPQNTNDKKRATIFAVERVFIHPAKAPLARNRDIVGASDILIAAPNQGHEVRRSGTWATIRYARSIPRCPTVILVDPEGFEFS